MKNQQRPIGPVPSDGSTLNVHSIFPTIQGEGPYAGKAAVFVRLADCNLRCPLCDTEYTGGLGEMDTPSLVAQVLEYGPRLCVITGGEPFRQNLCMLIDALTDAGMICQIETNGMLRPQGSPRSWKRADIVIAPKTHKLDEELALNARAFKYVLRAGDLGPDGLPRSALDHPLPVGTMLARPPAKYCGPIYIQPADEQDPVKNKANLDAATAAVMKNPRYTLGVQMHKIIGVE